MIKNNNKDWIINHGIQIEKIFKDIKTTINIDIKKVNSDYMKTQISFKLGMEIKEIKENEQTELGKTWNRIQNVITDIRDRNIGFQ